MTWTQSCGKSLKSRVQLLRNLLCKPELKPACTTHPAGPMQERSSGSYHTCSFYVTIFALFVATQQMTDVGRKSKLHD